MKPQGTPQHLDLYIKNIPAQRKAQAAAAPARPATSLNRTQAAHTRPGAKWFKNWKVAVPVVLGVSLMLGGGVFAYLRYGVNRAVAPVVTPEPTPPPPPPPAAPTPPATTKPSPLTGVQLPIAEADRAVQAVVIENHPDARPQSGLSEAGVVYEALAEGGITRFLAFFLDKSPKELGPVRSLRPYFIDWGLEYNAPVAHVGGSAEALALVGPTGLRDMNQFGYGSSFYRTRDRVAPHNAYTSGALMEKLRVKLGWNSPATFKANARKADSPNTQPAATNITINYSYAGYQVEYKYEASSNSYLRFLAGKPHIDRNTGQQIKVKNVVVEMMKTQYGAKSVIMSTLDNAPALVFRDGTVIKGSWVKKTRNSRTELKDGSGVEIPLNAGNTWYSIVPVGKTVTY